MIANIKKNKNKKNNNEKKNFIFLIEIQMIYKNNTLNLRKKY